MKINLTILKGKIAGIALAGMTGVMAVSPITAFAEEDMISCVCTEKCSEGAVNPECEVCAFDYGLCEGSEDAATEETVSEEPVTGDPVSGESDSEEPMEEKPEFALTPDGNLTLVDDFGTQEPGGKQFITAVTKSGHYFYIIIDRDDKGTETVHLLNLVDEADLLALMDEEQVEAYTSEIQQEDETVITPETGTKPIDDKKVEDPDKKPISNKSGMVGIIGILALAGGGAFMFMNKSKGKKTIKKTEDPDLYYKEDEADYLDSIPEEEMTIPEEEEE